MNEIQGIARLAGCRRCFPYRDAAGAREPMKPVIEITATVAGNSILVGDLHQ